MYPFVVYKDLIRFIDTISQKDEGEYRNCLCFSEGKKTGPKAADNHLTFHAVKFTK